jgi:glycosyltransferase involved in cell wall biosynthesis
MKIVQVSLTYDDPVGDEEAMLQKHYTITGWAEALNQAGADVEVISRFHRDSQSIRNGVRYRFIHDHLPANLRTRDIPLGFLRKVAAVKPDVFHLHNLSLSLHTLLLRLFAARNAAIIVQHHGGKSPGKTKRRLYNLFNRAADGFFFTTSEQGQEWFMKTNEFNKIMPIMEGSSFFDFDSRDAGRTRSFPDRQAARNKTGMHGDPVFLWVGRLDENKDPLTVLRGLESYFQVNTQARLYMIYNSEPLISAVRQLINQSTILSQCVHLLGNINHRFIESYYCSADYFILGSGYEGSGYALGEALRCGCVPIVTDIPSFRRMTNNGKFGHLWKHGKISSLIEALTRVNEHQVCQQGKEAMEFFENELSYRAIAEQAIIYYRHTIQSRRT